MVPFCMARKSSPGGHQLVGVEELDLHLALGDLVEGVDRRA